MTAQVSVVAWDFDGVLNRNVVGRHFIWVDDFEKDTGFPVEPFIAEVFGGDLEALLTGREDLRDKVETWSDKVGYEPGPDHLLDYWFNVDIRPDATMLAHMDRLSAMGVRQIMVTNNEARRTAFIETREEFAPRVEQIFAAGRMGLAKPDERFFHTVTEQLDVRPQEIMIVDDFGENVEAAIRCGWHGVHFTPETRDEIGALLPRR